MNEDTQMVDSMGADSDAWKILKALQQLAKEAADTSPEAKSADKIPSLEQLVGYILNSRLNLPIFSEQLSIIYQDYGQATPRYVAINGQVVDNNIPDSYSSKICPADHKLITEIIDNTTPIKHKKEEVVILDKDKLAELNGLFVGCQNVLLIPMRLTVNKRIGVFVVCDSHGDPRFTNNNQLIELLDIFSDLSAYFMRHNVRKRRNAALQRIQTEIMSLGETSSQLRGYEVIDAFMDGVKDEHGDLITGTGLKDWFVGAEAYLLMKHPLDTGRLAMAYDNEKAHDNYRINPEQQLSFELEKELFGGDWKALEDNPIPLNTIAKIKSAGITAECKSWIAAPLRLGKKTVIGFLILQNKYAEYAFEDGEDEMLDALSDFLALLLARLYRERISESWRAVRDYDLEHPKEHDERLEKLYEQVAEDLEVIHGVNELVITRYDHSNLGLNSVYTSSSQLDVLLEQHDSYASLEKMNERFVRTIINPDKPKEVIKKSFDLFRDAVVDILVSSRKVINRNVVAKQSAVFLTVYDTESGNKYLVSPMRTETHSIGCFIFLSPNISRFTAEKIDDLSDALGKKLANYGRWKRYALLTEFGLEVAKFSNASENKLIQLTYEFISRAMYTENLYIALYDPSSNKIRFPLALRNGKHWTKKNGFEDDVHGNVRFLNKDVRGKTEEIIVSEKYLLHLTRAEAKNWYKEKQHKDHAGNPLASWIGVPIFSEKGVIGVIAAFHDDLDYIYSNRDVFFLQEISFSVSGMLRSLELKERVVESEKLQKTIAKRENQLSTSLIAQDLTHRLKNSIGLISTNLEQVVDDIVFFKNTGTTKHFKNTIKSLENTEKVTNEILIDIEDITNDKNEEFNIIDLLHQAVNQAFIENRLDKNILNIAFDKSNNYELWLNRRLFYSCLYSLIKNACQAISRHQENSIAPRRNYLAITLKKSKDLIKISIKDNGDEIPEPIVRKLFEYGVSINGKNHGYGLWRSKSIANSFGGNVEYTKGGSTFEKEFILTIPTLKKAERTLVYIIEDEKGWSDNFKYWLSTVEGIDVKVANNIEESLDLINQDIRPDIVFLDISMSKKDGGNADGLSLIQPIRQTAPEAKLVIVTGYSKSAENYLDDIDLLLEKVKNGVSLKRVAFLTALEESGILPNKDD